MRADVLLLALLVGACGTSRAEPEPKPRPSVLKQMEAIDARAAAEAARLAPASAAPATAAAPALRRGVDLQLELGAARYLEALDGRVESRSLAEHVGRHRGAVLALWATWCKPCTSPEELAHLRRLKAALPPDYPLISMACDGMDEVRSDARALRWLYPLWQVDDGHLAVVPRAFIQSHGLGLPLFFLVDAEGRVAWFRTQALDDAAVREILTAAAP